ncbi:hypothetical protein HY732_03405, partial [Candidatus Uhrbacteria bacterium]|nr:hypothetical protein [Candidatus Uhrbacteria bacterium]
MTSCKQCKKEFEITDADREFYRKFDVSDPTQCPPCRMRRRLTFQNDKTLYARTSSKSKKQIISMYPCHTSFPVYDHEEWHADDWDPLSYGQPIDFSQPFFEQFKEVRNRVPRVNLISDSLCSNSPYVNGVSAVKNSHLIFASASDENCYYGYRIIGSKNCVDNLLANKCELSYECVEAYSSYNYRYCLHIRSCTDSAFLYVYKLFFCVALRNKSYCIFNVQYSKEEYEKKIKEHQLDSYGSSEKMKKRFGEFLLKFPRRFASLKNTENVTGDNIQNAKNCTAVFDTLNAENVSYAQFIDSTRDSTDLNYGFESELNYDSKMTGLHAYNVRFSTDVWPNVANLDYCDSCENISDRFGCVGLRKKQYCILNKQYTKEEYELFRGRLID